MISSKLDKSCWFPYADYSTEKLTSNTHTPTSHAINSLNKALIYACHEFQICKFEIFSTFKKSIVLWPLYLFLLSFIKISKHYLYLHLGIIFINIYLKFSSANLINLINITLDDDVNMYVGVLKCFFLFLFGSTRIGVLLSFQDYKLLGGSRFLYLKFLKLKMVFCFHLKSLLLGKIL